MRRFTSYIAAVLLAFGVFTLQFERAANAQKPRVFYIETQPDSPILIRDLEATVLPVNKSRSVPIVKVECFFENRSKKTIKRFSYQLPAENDNNYQDSNEAGRNGRVLPVGESEYQSIFVTIDSDSFVLRVKEVEFEDGTKWKAKPFNAATAKKSEAVKPVVEEPIDPNRTKRILTTEWTASIFTDRVTKTSDREPEVVEGITIQTKYHSIKEEIIDYVENCPPSEEMIQERDEALRDSESTPIEYDEKVSGFTTYEINGRILAYSISYSSVEEKTQESIGTGSQSLYVDETGGGTFKLRCDGIVIKTLPQWVKDLAKK